MADFGQGDEVVSKPAAAPTKSSWGSDDEVVTKPVEGKGGAAFGVYPKPGMQPMKPGETSSLGAFGASALESAAATPGVLVGARAGSAIAPPVAPFVGTLSKPIGGVLGGVAGGMLANMGINSLEQFADTVFGTDIVGTRQQQMKQYPYASLAGQVAGGGINPWMRPTIPSSLGQAAVGGGVMGVVGAGQRAIHGEDVLDPTAMAIDVGTGAFTKPTKLGERLLGHTPTATTKKTTVGDFPEKPPEGATPEEKAEYLKKLEAIKAERDSKAPLVETAIRNKATGEIERMGPKHDQARKEATKDTHEEGFIDERGNFHERQAAVEQAKRAGQIPEDHVLENPPGERPGLHSGDLRKVGDKRFAITEDQPAGKSKPPVDTPPVTRQEHKDAIDKLEEQAYMTLEINRQIAQNTGDIKAVAEIETQQAKIEQQIADLRKSMPGVDFKSKMFPTWEELHDHLYGAKTVGDAFDKVISTDGLGTKGQRALLKVLNQSGFIRDANLQFTNDYLKYIDPKDGKEKNAAGLYTGGDQHLVQLAKDGDIRVLAHEAMHAGTQRLLSEGNSPAAIRLQELHKKFLDKYETEYEAALEKFKQEKVQPTMAELREFDKQYKKHYGLTDVHEFVSEAFTNKEFQKLLSGVKTTTPEGKLSNLWNDFKNIIREGLNIPEGERTAFDEVIEVGSTLVEESKGFKREGVGEALPSKTTSSSDELAEKTSEPVAKEFKKLDPRSMPSEEAMLEHATDIYERYGEADAIQFFDDYKKNLNERSIPVPNNNAQLDDMLHKMNTYVTKDRSEHVVGYEQNTKNGVTEQQRAQWFDMRERGMELPPEGKAVLDAIDAENIALVRKAKGMGLEVGEEFTSGQSRIRLFSEKEKPGWKESIKKFFSNDTPMGDKIADQADAAIERKVYQTDDGRVIEFHRQPQDVKTPQRDIKKGTEIFEWKDGQKRLIGYSEDLNFKRGDKFTTKDGKEVTVIDGRVPDIERHSPYRYLHDAEASARIANMGLRKMVREAEAIENLKKSELFKQVGHSPDQPLKDLPKGWKQPENIDRIPQLRGWAFDPKTRVIIEDFARVWDNSMYMKLSNAIVKNMMLNPIPHIFNEVMHLWNARGFTGWVDPRRLGTFADTARVAWRDVGNQTQFYRDIMREGGSILGADPRNKGYFDTIQKEASKQMFGTPEMEKNMAGLAKKLGVPVANLYNGISEASQKAMWFTRDWMYVQLVREIMARQEKSGNKITLKEAIDQAERHMPNYRLPSEVAGSRTVSAVLRDPRISMFSRYHYGMVKSLVNTLKDIDPRNLKTPEGREHFREGVDSMLAIGVAIGALYPIMDSIAQAMFGEEAEQRRAGPFHLLHAGMDVVSGKKDATALIWPVFTFNPVLLSLGQLFFNKKLFTGKEIYHPDDDLSDIMGDIGAYSVGQVPQAPPLLSATAEEGGATKLLARQLDIKAKTPEQIAREERAKKRQERVKKGRDTKREKGTYKP